MSGPTTEPPTLNSLSKQFLEHLGIVNSLEVVPKRLLDFLVKTAHPSWVVIYHRTLDFIKDYNDVKCYKQVGLWILDILDRLLDRHGDTVLSMDSPLTLCSSNIADFLRPLTALH